MHAIKSYVAEARFGAANLNVFAFTLIALERHAEHAADRIRDIGIGQADDYVRWQHLDDIVGGEFPVKSLDLAPLAVTTDDHLLSHRIDLEHGIHVCRASRSNGHLLGKRRKSDVGNGNRVSAG